MENENDKDKKKHVVTEKPRTNMDEHSIIFNDREVVVILHFLLLRRISGLKEVDGDCKVTVFGL